MRALFAIIIVASTIVTAFAENPAPAKPVEYATQTNIFYLPIPEAKADEYQKKQCRLDIYYPKNVKNFATIVWFHGGGLKGGEKGIPEEFKKKASQ